MKTPREILLQRHRRMEANLDLIRRQVVDHLKPATHRRPVFTALWLELVWPCRRIWVGLATAWMAIVVSNLAAGNGAASHTAQASASDPEIRMAIMERRQLMAQLLGPGAPEAVLPPKRQEPRSEWSGPISFA